jgi:4-hydroxy-tetrahydrodipicolinate synthase
VKVGFRMSALKGVWVPVLTPQNSDLLIDKNRFFHHLDWLFQHEINGVVLFGTNGEASSFSAQERMLLLEWVKKEGISNEKVIVGTGCSALTDTIALIEHAIRLGYFHHLVLPPFYYKNPTINGLVNNYSEIINRIDNKHLKIYLYNFPQLSGIQLGVDLVEILSEKFPKNIVGYKDSSGDWDNTSQIMEKCPQISMFPGSEIFLSKALEKGAAGVITGTGNVNPGMVKQTYEAFYNDKEKSIILQKKIDAFRTAVQKYPLISALKGLIEYYRKDEGWQYLRPPLTALSKADLENLIKSIDPLEFSLKS